MNDSRMCIYNILSDNSSQDVLYNRKGFGLSFPWWREHHTQPEEVFVRYQTLQRLQLFHLSITGCQHCPYCISTLEPNKTLYIFNYQLYKVTIPAN